MMLIIKNPMQKLSKNFFRHKAEGEERAEEMAPGTILRGRIVEIGKDYVVVDVGLKSEGFVPTGVFRSRRACT